MRPTPLSGVIVTVLLFSFASPSVAENGLKAALLQKAAINDIAGQTAWWKLLHYHSFSFPPGVRSLVDDSRFFLSPKGKTDPAAELDAFIAELVEPSSADTAQDVRCRFPARYHWLKEQLSIDGALLPTVACTEFSEWYAALDPAGITLIFPAAYPNNPSSAFGHTLLRIDHGNQATLLSYTANFAADAADENALVYALKGIFGGYVGTFSLAPYFKKIQQYGDLEHRDIWEYQLALSKAEVAQAVRHIWELQLITFDYFYFDENCSYQLLSVLDVARPGLTLLEQFPTWVIPVDTVRAVVESEGLIKTVAFRPSSARVLRHKLSGSSSTVSAVAKKLAEGKLTTENEGYTTLNESDRALSLELGYDYLQYLLAKRERDTEEVRASMFHLLRERSSLDTSAEVLSMVEPEIRPEQGHQTARLRIATGSYKGRGYGTLAIRPAYHDLLDPPGGYTEGAGIEFFDFSLRLEEREGVQFESFTPLRIESITPWDNLIRPMSWSVSFGVKRVTLAEDSRPVAAQGNVGFGLAESLGNAGTIYLLATGSSGATDAYEENYTLGVGARGGVITHIGDQLSMRIEGETSRFFLGEVFTEFSYGLESRISLTKDVAFRLMLTRKKAVAVQYGEALFSLDYYF